MCFENNKTELDRARARKTPFIVWKTTPVHLKTGIARTCLRGEVDEVWWIKGKIVKPDKILQPLKQQEKCSSGLYFYTRETDAIMPYRQQKALIKCSVKPEHIIAVNYDGTQMLATQAKVLQAPNPDPKMMRIKWLKGKLTLANSSIETEERNMNEWLKRKEEELEARQHIRDELNALKDKRIVIDYTKKRKMRKS